MNRLRKRILEKISKIPIQSVNFENIQLEVPVKAERINLNQPILHCTLTRNIAENDCLLEQLTKINYDLDIVENVRLLPASKKYQTKLEFQIKPQTFLEDTLQISLPNYSGGENVVFDFSSPNIAKPFHVGHLRSTIIGNMLSNLYKHLGHKVTNINYLGDWGTQFGMLQVGVELLQITEEQMRQSPIEFLYKAYVAANTAAKTDSIITERARSYFAVLESGENADLYKQWHKYRQYTVEELQTVYDRLGVHFDTYDWESQYGQQHIGNVVSALEHKGLLHAEEDGRKVVLVGDRRVPVVKSDGSTLYLTRDIAAILDRLQRFEFQRIFYVVENSQTDHFNALFATTQALHDELTADKMTHVKFGRIHGMSTRSGNAVFLRDVLDEARSRMLEKQIKSSTTKVELNSNEVDANNIADILGVTAVVINDLKQRRQRDYDFDWEKALQMTGDTGIKMQYTHCRLYSLMQQVATDVNVKEIRPNVQYLMEPEAQDVIFELARFEQVLYTTKSQLEACVLVNYLFGLCNSTSRALKHLNVKNELDLEKRKNRILLFSAIKTTLSRGMQILGLRPLNQM